MHESGLVEYSSLSRRPLKLAGHAHIAQIATKMRLVLYLDTTSGSLNTLLTHLDHTATPPITPKFVHFLVKGLLSWSKQIYT